VEVNTTVKTTNLIAKDEGDSGGASSALGQFESA
jgi:hypothetical protein